MKKTAGLKRGGVAALTALGLSVLAGCAPGGAAPAAAKPANPAPSNPASPSLGATAQGVTVNLPDAKRPGKLLLAVRAKSATGQSQDNGFLGSMRGIYARLYQAGVPSAILTAPKAQGRSVRNTVVVTCTGGVVVKSLTQPGTVLTADTMVWYASINKIVATGHVFYKDGKSGATMSGPEAVADTKLKALHLSSGGHASATF